MLKRLGVVPTFVRGVRQASTVKPGAENGHRKPKGRSDESLAVLERISKLVNTRAETKIAPNLLPIMPNDKLTYEPSDFSLEAKRRRTQSIYAPPKEDVFERTKINPLDLWKSPTVLSNYITSNGKIIPGYLLGMKGKNHKKLAKAIRRCRASGLLSHVHRSVDSF